MNGAYVQNGIVTNVAFFAAGDDPAKYGYIACGDTVAIGDTYSNGQFGPPPSPPPPTEEQVRQQRDTLLYQCDWTMLPDAPPEVVKADWEVYRQALRDVTNQPGFPANVVWPTAPFVIGPW